MHKQIRFRELLERLLVLSELKDAVIEKMGQAEKELNELEEIMRKEIGV